MWKSRIVWLGLFILSLIGISFYGKTISFCFFYAVLLVPVFSLLYIFLVYLTFKIYQRVDGSDIVANEPVPYYFTLQNEGFLSFAGIRVKFFGDFSKIGEINDNREYELFPSEGVKLSTTLCCKYRGEYEVGIERAEITDFFRLFKISYRNKETLRVTVRPKMIFVPGLKSENSELMSARDSFINKNTPDVLSREYAAGDDIRKIRWKLLASTGKLMVRNDIGEEKLGIGVVLSTLRCGKRPMEYLPVESRMLECALAIVLYYAGKNTPVNTEFFKDGIVKCSIGSVSEFEDIYEKFCNVSFEEDYSDEVLLENLLSDRVLFESRVVFFVVSRLSAKLYSACELLNGNNVSVFIYKVGEDRSDDMDFSKLPSTGLLNVPTDGELEEVI